MDYPLYFTARLTAYFPPPPGGYKNTIEARLEGGPLDFMSYPLHSLQSYLAGASPFVSVALDPLLMGTIVAYGSRIELPSFSRVFGRPGIPFRAVDKCDRARGRGLEHIDVCVDSYASSQDPRVNSIHSGVLWFSVPYPPAHVEP